MKYKENFSNHLAQVLTQIFITVEASIRSLEPRSKTIEYKYSFLEA